MNMIKASYGTHTRNDGLNAPFFNFLIRTGVSIKAAQKVESIKHFAQIRAVIVGFQDNLAGLSRRLLNEN